MEQRRKNMKKSVSDLPNVVGFRAQVTVLLLFLPKIGILLGLSHKKFACVPSAPLCSIAPQRRIGERQLWSGVDPKMKSEDAGAQKKE
jgi:hypothetical protein